MTGTLNAIGSENFIYPNDSGLFKSLSYKDWMSKWYQWWMGLPWSEHPYRDPTNTEKCSLMQSGPIWFLPPISDGQPKENNTFHCDVPIGKDIYMQVSTTECDKSSDDVDPNRLETYSDCVGNIDTTNKTIDIKVDGTPIDASKLHQVSGNFFNVTFNKDPAKIFTNDVKPGGTYLALIRGLYTILHELPAGQHNIKFTVVDKLRENTGIVEHRSEGTYTLFVK